LFSRVSVSRGFSVSVWFGALLGMVADGFDVVAIRIPDENAVVGRVVLRPQSRLVQHFRSGSHRGFVECDDGGAVRGGEGNMCFPGPIFGSGSTQPEDRAVRSVGD